MFDRITHDPNVLAGRATLRGLRISAAHVVNLVANGMTPAQDRRRASRSGGGGRPPGIGVRGGTGTRAHGFEPRVSAPHAGSDGKGEPHDVAIP